MYEINYEREMQLAKERDRLRQLKKENPAEYEKIMNERKAKKAKKKQVKELKSVKKSVKKVEKQEDIRYKALNKKEKVLLAKALKKNNELFRNITTNSTTIITKTQQNITVKTYKDAVEHLITLDLTKVLNLNVVLGENFKCKIVNGNIASVNRDANGHYKYFLRSRDGKNKIVLDIVDLFEIIYNVNYYKAVNIACKLTKIDVEENTWANMQKIRYVDNIAEIENANDEMAVRYPALFKYIEKHLYLLEKMNNIGIANIATQKEALDGESIFFVSTNFIEKDLENTANAKDQSTINRVLNMFCALGLVEKVPTKKVPKHMISRAMQKTENEKYNFTVTFYKIPEMTTEVLLEAEKRVVKLKKAKVSALQINTNNLEKILGKRVFKAVYQDTVAVTNVIKKTKNKRADEYKERRELRKKGIFADMPL